MKTGLFLFISLCIGLLFSGVLFSSALEESVEGLVLEDAEDFAQEEDTPVLLEEVVNEDTSIVVDRNASTAPQETETEEISPGVPNSTNNSVGVVDDAKEELYNPEEISNDTHTPTYDDFNETTNFSDDDYLIVSLEDIVPTLKNSSLEPTPMRSSRTNGGDPSHSLGEYNETEDVVEQESPQRALNQLITERLVKQGKIEVEYEVEIGVDVSIEKKELLKNSREKRIRISSEEHFNSPLRVYSDLPDLASPENIIIYWENNETEVSRDDIEYYFSAEHPHLVERVSWIVPHLSIQYYSIIIDVASSSSANATSITLEVFSPEEGSTVPNPVPFGINITYANTSSVECALSIDGEGALFGVEGVNFSINLSEGSHSWDLHCEDITNSSIFSSESGSFFVEDLFEITSLKTAYLNGSSFSGSVSANGGTVDMYLIDPDGDETFLYTLSGSYPQTFSVEEDKLTSVGTYFVKAVSNYYTEPAIITTSFSTIYASALFEETEGTVDESTSIQLFLETPITFVGSYFLQVNGETIDGGSFVNTTKSVSFTPDSNTDYRVGLEIFIESDKYTSLGNTLTAHDGEDTEKPEITLLYPDDDDVIRSDEIEFRYEAEDNTKLLNCSFKLYNSSDGLSDEVVFPLSSSDINLAKQEDLANGEEVKTRLIDFDEGEYFWEVECYDNSTNYAWDLHSFHVSFSGDVISTSSRSSQNSGEDYDKKEEVDEILLSINNFLEAKESYGLRELEVLDVMGISEAMTFHKKKVLQIEQDLQFNLNFVEQSKREKRTQEIYDELESIREKLVTDVEVLETYEYSKTSLDTSLEDIVSIYLEDTNTSLKRGSFNALVENNEKLQSELLARVTVKKIRISSLDADKEVLLVSKNIGDLDFDGIFLEYIVDMGPVHFLTPAEPLGDSLFLISSEDIVGETITYFVNESLPERLTDLEKTELVLFKEHLGEDSLGFTGNFLAVGDGLSSNYLFWFFVVLFGSVVFFYAYDSARLVFVPRDTASKELLSKLRSCSKLIAAGNLSSARDQYNLIGSLYQQLPEKKKKALYKRIEKLSLEINKRDVLNLLEEYKKARQQGRADDARLMYSRINAIYVQLPKTYRLKVFKKIKEFS